MSLYAMSWALSASNAAGNDRLVVIVMAHHTDADGFAALSRITLAGETRLSESTIHRSQLALVRMGEITRVIGDNGPQWWLDIPQNRRPSLYAMTGFLGSQFATPSVSGGSRGVLRGVTEDHDPPSDLGKRDANYRSLKELNTNASASQKFSTGDPDCVRCRGIGVLYGGAVERPCSCCDARPLVAVEL